jgi:preprotein translocase subunit YajC
MNLFVADAWAQAAPTAQEPGAFAFLPLIILFVVFYLFLIRPQVKRQKEHQKLVQALGKGDEVVTSGGIAGRITEVGDNFLRVEIAKGIEVRVQKPAITTVLPKGTLKDL